MPDASEPEREDRVLVVPRVVMRGAVAGQDGEVGLAAEPFVQRTQQLPDRHVLAPRVLEPALPHLGVRAAVDPALGAVLARAAAGSRAGRRCG